ncbi:hypothetical protein BSKO_03018 [Bryopsis sp. KO-2023]|nr:hypothetical protein BSKO_03018 [Bryopsis sp. KO-2023]
MGLWTLVQGLLMVLNGIAILNNDRFLEKCGWGFSYFQSGASPTELKYQVIGGIHAVHYMRTPLVAINVVVIIVKLLFG